MRSIRSYSWSGLIVAACGVLVWTHVLRAQTDPAPARNTIPAAFQGLTLCFVENRGQLPEEVAFSVTGSDKTLHFTAHGVTYVLKKAKARWVVKLDFVGSDPAARPIGEERRPGVFSYFRGEESSWTRGARTYGTIRYRNLWPGIDLVYEAQGHGLKHAFRVRPGADPERIRFVVKGAERIVVDPRGRLCVETPVGSIEDAAPVAFQVKGGHRQPVDAAYTLAPLQASPETEVGFRLGAYDPEAELVIDPVVLVYCGYIGGARADGITGIRVDTFGNTYVVGGTGSNETTFPVKVGPDLTYAGESDVFVAKVNASGNALVYCGYIGGKYNERGNAIAVDSAGNAYLTGLGGHYFPRKIGPNPTQEFGAFVTKINPDGTDLVYSGFIGGKSGAGLTEGEGIAVDAAGNAYVTGRTEVDETSFPVKLGPGLEHQGVGDVFVAKVNASGTELVYCGYIGGWLDDRGDGIAIDALGRAYITGSTCSDEKTFPVRIGPDLTFNSYWAAWSDAFVARVNAAGTALDYCGYIGGMDGDSAYGIGVDSQGHAYVSGITLSDEQSFPVRVGPDLTYNGSGDVFVAKVAPDGTGLVYCGYIGGSGNERGNALAVDTRGAAYVTGYTGSSEKTFPVTVGPDLSINSGTDAYVAKVAPDGTRLVYCGYIGGERAEDALAIAVDRSGNAYVGGSTESSEATFPVHGGPFLNFKGTGPFPSSDAFVAKIALVLLEGSGSIRPGGRVDFDLTASDDAGYPYQLASSFGPGPIAIDTRTIDLTYDGLLWISLSSLIPSMFVDYAGTIGSDGHARAALHLPDLPQTVGLKIHSAFVTLEAGAPSGVRSISNPYTFTIVP